MGYAFYWYPKGLTVEIPELDAFLAELEAVFQKHGAALALNRGGGGDEGSVYLLPAHQWDRATITDSLSEADSGIPWLDRARREWNAKREAVREAERQIEDRRQAAELEATRARSEAHIREHGIMFTDGLYRVVKVRDEK